MMVLDDTVRRNACIKVVGVGGAGGNVINTMIEEQVDGVEFIAINTDIQALSVNYAETKIQIGETKTRGLGAGSTPNVGREAALETQSIIQDTLEGADMVFITAGMGGGTGTGASPVIAEIAKKNGALTVGVVTKPFAFEGKRRRRQAEEGLENLRNCVDTLIVIPNERLLQVVGEAATLEDSFKKVDDVLLNAVRSISDIIVKTGMINLDFADVKTVMINKGIALMGTGVATGPDRATEAAEMAINSPLLDDITIKGATSVLLNITASRSVGLAEISTAAQLIEEECSENVHLIFGHVVSPDDDEEFKITVIATGFEDVYQEEANNPNIASFHIPNQHHNPYGLYQEKSAVKQNNPYAPAAAFMPQSSKAVAFVPQQQAAFMASPAQTYNSPFAPSPNPDTAQLDALVSEPAFTPRLNHQPASSYAPKSNKQSFLPMMEEFPPNNASETNAALHESLNEISAKSVNQLQSSSVNSGLTPEEEREIDKPAFMRKASSKKFFME